MTLSLNEEEKIYDLDLRLWSVLIWWMGERVVALPLWCGIQSKKGDLSEIYLHYA